MVPGCRGGGSLEHSVLGGHGGGHVAGQPAPRRPVGRLRLRGVERVTLLEQGVVHRLHRQIHRAPRGP